MNRNAKKLKMENSFYDSPHGLANKLNYSCAEDQAILITECMKLKQYRTIVGTKKYIVSLSKTNRDYFWENGNVLLMEGEPGIVGTKCGWTPNAAGPCNAAYYEANGL